MMRRAVGIAVDQHCSAAIQNIPSDHGRFVDEQEPQDTQNGCR